MPFALLTTQRSGSTWLTDLLARHSRVRMFGEVFLNRPRNETALNRHLLPPARFHEYRLQHSSSPRPFVTWRYLDTVRRLGAGRAAVGFKLMYDQALRLPELPLALWLKRFRLIHLIRENALDVLVSNEMMLRHRRIHTSAPLADEQVSLDIATLAPRLRRHVRRIDAARTALRASRVRFLEVKYEELLADPAPQLLRISDFLGIPAFATDLASRFVRVNPGSVRNKISNYDEVAAALATSGFLRFLH